MKSKIWPILAIVFGLLLVLIIPGLFMIGHLETGYFGPMMVGPRMMGGGGGYFHPFRWIGGLFACLLPISALVLLVFGVASLVNRKPAPAVAAPAAPERQCANCSKTAQSDWTTCPYCGQPLKE
jgi:hypothetical protein